MILEKWLIIIILILGFPIGYLLARLCRDELKEGRRYFRVLTIISSILGIIFLFLNLEIGFSLVFISIVAYVSYFKSKDKKFIRP
jgi:NhaP-type Na+/H+ or K+/H+ antiporter